MKEQNSNKLRYYRDCFSSDSRELTINNILKTNEDQRYFFQKNENLLSGAYPRVPVPRDIGANLVKITKQYYREKQLVYGLHFVVGTLKSQSFQAKPQNIKVCAPLVFINATIEQEEGNFFILAESDWQLNDGLIRQLMLPEAILEELEEILRDEKDFQRFTRKLEKWLALNSIITDSIELLNYPQLASDEELESATKARKKCSAVCSAAVFIVDRPQASRGVCYALEKIADQQDFSAPLLSLLGETSYKAHKQKSQAHILPVQLSDAQKQTLNIAATETLGVISGPPGTGKSFTIAATIIDRVLNGEKVLVVSETEQAVEVIANKLRDEFTIEEGVVRAGRSQYLSELKDYLEDLLKLGLEAVSEEQMTQLNQALNQCVEKIQELEKAFHERSDRALERGEKLANIHNKEYNALLSRVLKTWISYRVKGDTRQWHILEELYALEREKAERSQEYIAKLKSFRVCKLLDQHRRQLVRFNQGIRARTSLKQKETFESIDYRILLEAFPIWLVSLSSLHKVLPLEKELFDLVIFDEASQCNIAAALPAIQRAKRLMVVGDAKQLRHVSFLSRSKEAQLRDKYQLTQHDVPSFRENSILDFASDQLSSQSAMVLLDEHFRSRPDIIAFSNETFYRKRLKVMQYRPEAQDNKNIHLHFTNGSRDQAGVNNIEAQHLIRDIEQLIQSQIDCQPSLSIGILSPYRNQAEYLKKLVFNKFDPVIVEKHKIHIGTPYHFQGEERDLMYLSFSLCPDSMRAAAYLNKADMFNVSITRAKQQQHIYVSLAEDNLPGNNLLTQYISASQSQQSYSPPIQRDKFQDAVCTALHKHNIQTWKNYPIANCTMDILCKYKNNYLAIDLVGYPGINQDYYTLNTYKLFQRAGLEVLPISYATWCEFEKESIATLCQALGALAVD